MSRLFALSAFVLMILPVHPLFADEMDVEIVVTKEDCRRVEKHIARADVTYKPGVDVYGRPVVPADLEESRLKLPDNITIDLSLPLQDLFKRGHSPNPVLKDARVQVGKLDYNMLSGKLKFNGQELADPALNAIAVQCRKIYADNGS